MLAAGAGKRVAIRDRATIIQLVKRTYGRTFEYEIVNGESRGDVSSTSAAMGNPLSSYSA